MSVHFNAEQCHDLQFVRSREWLVTNGIGGYASSTIAGMNTRRYHALLVAATAPPLGRMVLLSKMEETLIVDGVRYPLSTHLYQGEVVSPQGYLLLRDFRLDPDPVFTYGDGAWKITKKISMIHDRNATIVEYALSSTGRPPEVSIEIRPLLAFRDYHGTTHENDVLDRTVVQADGLVSVEPYAGLPTLYMSHDAATVQLDQHWYKGFVYEQERERGLDFTEDLFSPFVLHAPLDHSGHFRLIASTEPIPVSVLEEAKPFLIQRKEMSRPTPAQSTPGDLILELSRAAEQFVVTRAPFKTVIAGYHWFGDWGRDTMIALPGLLLATDQPFLAREILRQYLSHVDQGMLPNRFPDDGEQPEYNTVDATLWFFESIRQYVHHRSDAAWRREAIQLLRDELYEPLRDILRWHMEGTRYDIHCDEKGFLWAGNADTQLTWMDARVGGVAITPRHGRPVEIQALWYNALCTFVGFAQLLDDAPAATPYAGIADRLKRNFEATFWNEETSCLLDVAGDGGNDPSIRPNQLLTISLHHPLLSGERARQVIEVVEKTLLTPFGLRTLAATDPHYRGIYHGDAWSRDSAYHQGTVWPWLAGPFFRAKLLVHASSSETLDQLDSWLTCFANHLGDGGVGQVSEIFDGDSPHLPRGCIAQAWSIAEILQLAKLRVVERSTNRKVAKDINDGN